MEKPVYIGGQAISRYHQLRTFSPNDDSPHYNDHDFPVPGYLMLFIVPINLEERFTSILQLGHNGCLIEQ